MREAPWALFRPGGPHSLLEYSIAYGRQNERHYFVFLNVCRSAKLEVSNRRGHGGRFSSLNQGLCN
jgi:hypothetical protein